MKKGRNLKLRLLVVLLLTFAAVQAPFMIASHPRFQQWFLKSYRPFAPWQVRFESFKIKPWKLKAEVQKLNLSHPSGHQISLDSIQLKVKFLRIFRGQLALEPFTVKSLNVTIATSLFPQPMTKKKKFKLRTLLLIQNLMLEKAQIKNIRIRLPKENEATIESLNIDLKPSLLKAGTRLNLNLHGVQLKSPVEKKVDSRGLGRGNLPSEQREREGEAPTPRSGVEGATRAPIIESENLKLFATTNFTRWSKTFPYIDDVEGDLVLEEVSLRDLILKKVGASLSFNKSELVSKKFFIQVGENVLLGKLKVNMSDQKFGVNLDTPKPLNLPEIGSEIRTFNTAGDLSLQLNLEGQGFGLNNSQGKGSLMATHHFKNFEDFPVDVQTLFDWKKGVVYFQEAKVTTDNASIHVGGTFDLKPPAFHLTMKAKEFPLTRFFEKFADINLNPIHGKANADATLDGFAKTIHLRLNGEAFEGGYGPLLAEKAAVTLELTYNGLKLNGKIFSGEKTSGEASLAIDYGPKTPGQIRPKKVSLLAKLNDQSLEETLPGYHLTGNVDGEISLTGSPQNIQGEGNLSASQGSFFGEGFDSIQSHFKLSAKKLTIDKADFIFSDVISHLVNPLTFDFMPGSLKISGKPFAGIQLDVLYKTKEKLWQINKFIIEDVENPELKSGLQGSFSPTFVNLKGQGSMDLSRLKFLTKYIREAVGTAQFNLTANGKLPSLNLNGNIHLKNNTLSFRAFPYSFEDLNGALTFHGNKIQTDGLEGSLGIGKFRLQGFLSHAEAQASSYDLKLKGNQLYFRNQDGKFRMEYDADLALKGAAQNPELSGSITILDGRYSKDFNVIEELREAPKATQEIRQAATIKTPFRLNLKVKNLGDIIVDNNVGRIELACDLDVKGTQILPAIEGSIAVTEGKIYYLGLDLDITRGFMEFRGLYAYPYLEINAEQDIADAHITARLYGRTDNLRIDLQGNSAREGPLEKKDVLSLILFGMTTNERLQQAAFFQRELGPELVAEQITHALQRPIAKATRLDIVRLEAKPTQDGRVQTFYLGKRLNDRLTLEFASEVNREDAIQSFRLEYWLTDFFIVKGSRRTDESYQLNMGLRFTSR